MKKKKKNQKITEVFIEAINEKEAYHILYELMDDYGKEKLMLEKISENRFKIIKKSDESIFG